MVILALFAPVSVFLVASSKVAGASIDSANGDASMMQLEYLKGYCNSEEYEGCQATALEDFGNCSASDLDCQCQRLTFVKETCRQACPHALDDAVSRYLGSSCPLGSEVETAGWRRKYLSKLRYLAAHEDPDECTGDDDDDWADDDWPDEVYEKRSLEVKPSEMEKEVEDTTPKLQEHESVELDGGEDVRVAKDSQATVHNSLRMIHKQHKNLKEDDSDCDDVDRDDSDELCEGDEENEEEEEDDDDDSDDDCDNGDDSDDGSRYHVYPPRYVIPYRPIIQHPQPIPVAPTDPRGVMQPSQNHNTNGANMTPQEKVSIYEPESESKSLRDENPLQDIADVMSNGIVDRDDEAVISDFSSFSDDDDDDDDNHQSLAQRLGAALATANHGSVFEAQLASLLHFPRPLSNTLFCQRQKGGRLCWIPDNVAGSEDNSCDDGGCEDQSEDATWRDKMNFCRGDTCFGFNKFGSGDRKDSGSSNGDCFGELCGRFGASDKPFNQASGACHEGENCSGDSGSDKSSDGKTSCEAGDTTCDGLMRSGPKRPTPSNMYGNEHQPAVYPTPYFVPPKTPVGDCPAGQTCTGYGYDICADGTCRGRQNLMQSPPEDVQPSVELSGVANEEGDDSDNNSSDAERVASSPAIIEPPNNEVAEPISIHPSSPKTIDAESDSSGDKFPDSKGITESRTKLDKFKKTAKEAAGLVDPMMKKAMNAPPDSDGTLSTSANWTAPSTNQTFTGSGSLASRVMASLSAMAFTTTILTVVLSSQV